MGRSLQGVESSSDVSIQLARAHLHREDIDIPGPSIEEPDDVLPEA